jgi:homoserine kinase
VVSLKDAVFNVSRAALFTAAWATGSWEHLLWAMEDKLHQQFRAKLFRGRGDSFGDRKSPECMGVAISGSGPSMMAFVREIPREWRGACADLLGEWCTVRFFCPRCGRGWCETVRRWRRVATGA